MILLRCITRLRCGSSGNRLVRTRMPGGGGGREEDPLLPDSTCFFIFDKPRRRYILRYIPARRFVMQTAKIFTNGRSQAIRLPKDFRFSGEDVYINKIGKIVILIPKDDPWSVLANSLDQFSDDFMDDRKQPLQDSREEL